MNVEATEEECKVRIKERSRLEDSGLVKGSQETRLDKRMRIHQEVAEPIIESYKAQNLVTTVDNNSEGNFDHKIDIAIESLKDKGAISEDKQLIINKLWDFFIENNYDLG